MGFCALVIARSKSSVNPLREKSARYFVVNRCPKLVVGVEQHDDREISLSLKTPLLKQFQEIGSVPRRCRFQRR